jgi:hypothetical protein
VGSYRKPITRLYIAVVCAVSHQALRRWEKGNGNGEHLDDKTLNGWRARKTDVYKETDIYKEMYRKTDI